jgi:hypothetical protein
MAGAPVIGVAPVTANTGEQGGVNGLVKKSRTLYQKGT